MIISGLTISHNQSANMRDMNNDYYANEAESIVSQMKAHHLAAFNLYKDCKYDSTCSSLSNERLSVDDVIGDIANENDAIISFIEDGKVITIYNSHINRPSAAYTVAKRISNTHFIGGKAEKEGGSYQLTLPSATDYRTNERFGDVSFSANYVLDSQQDSLLAFVSSEHHISDLEYQKIRSNY